MRSTDAIFRLFFALVLAAASACGTTYGIYHRVEPGESIPTIARTYGVDEEALRIINSLDEGPVAPGHEIFIPGASRRRYVSGSLAQKPAAAQKGKGKKGGAVTARPEVARVHPDTGADRDVTPGAGKPRFLWPANGVLFSKYGQRDGMPHDGIDISAPTGTPVYAAADGRVIYSGDGVRGYGNLIIVKHEGFYSTVYAHNEENLVGEGDFVEAGQLIAKLGQTGRASGPHLHFEVRFKSKPVDPVKHLPVQAAKVSQR
jgi:murein DD-endopeptidase MepM/ murein hydrolase activator NlpD